MTIWTLHPGDEYTTQTMGKSKGRAKRKPPMKAVSRRILAAVRAMSRATKPLSLSDLEWRALSAGPARSRQRRSA